MLISIVPFLVMLIGLLLFVLSTNGKISEIGDRMFLAGLVVLLLTLTSQAVHFIR